VTQEEINAEHDERTRRLRIATIVTWLVFLAFVAAWVISFERIQTLSKGPEVQSVLSRCALYRRCCRPGCRFVEVEHVRL
jgi:hypothetical protein